MAVIQPIGRAKQPGPASADTLDVGALPTCAFGSNSTTWWGIMGLIAIESTVFGLAIMSYFYLRSHTPSWPPNHVPPDLMWGTINTLVMLASGIPNWYTRRAAERLDLIGVRVGICTCFLFALAILGLRAGEFSALNVRWNDNAYGSIVWMLLGLHTTHLITDAYDTLVLAALFFTERLECKRYVDASENAAYWYFVIISWLVIYAVIYWGARL